MNTLDLLRRERRCVGISNFCNRCCGYDRGFLIGRGCTWRQGGDGRPRCARRDRGRISRRVRGCAFPVSFLLEQSEGRPASGIVRGYDLDISQCSGHPVALPARVLAEFLQNCCHDAGILERLVAYQNIRCVDRVADADDVEKRL